MSEDNKVEAIKFVAQISRSGRKRLINIPSELHDKLNEGYYKVYLVPVKFDDI